MDGKALATQRRNVEKKLNPLLPKHHTPIATRKVNSIFSWRGESCGTLRDCICVVQLVSLSTPCKKRRKDKFYSPHAKSLHTREKPLKFI